ncbi:MAG: hypothetical protein C4335_11000 [Armatimonadota bacterium]
MFTDHHRADAGGNSVMEQVVQPLVHLHLRAQEGVYALYGTPFPLRLCAEILREYLQGRYLLVLSFSSKQALARPDLTLVQWFRQQGLQAHSVRSFALLPVQQVQELARLVQTHLAFTDTPLSPDELARVDIEPLIVDTFASPTWYTVLQHEVGATLYWESRDDRFSHLLCRERPVLAGVLSQLLRRCLQTHQPELAVLDDFPPLIHEQLWQYAGQGLAPMGVTATPHGVELQVALGTPDRSVCVLAQSCPHFTQIQRGFILRWQNGNWDLCSTESVAEG